MDDNGPVKCTQGRPCTVEQEIAALEILCLRIIDKIAESRRDPSERTLRLVAVGIELGEWLEKARKQRVKDAHPAG